MQSLEQESRKDREKLLRRQEILHSAVKLFAEKGFSTTTIDDIAASAEFGKGTIYNYFQSKEDIYFEIINDVLSNQKLIVNEADRTNPNPLEFIRDYTLRIFEYCFNNKYAFLLFAREVSQLSNENFKINLEYIHKEFGYIKNVFIKKIEKGIKTKIIKKMDADKISSIYNHLVYSYIHHLMICPQDNFNHKLEADIVLSVFFEGITQ